MGPKLLTERSRAEYSGADAFAWPARAAKLLVCGVNGMLMADRHVKVVVTGGYPAQSCASPGEGILGTTNGYVPTCYACSAKLTQGRSFELRHSQPLGHIFEARVFG